MKIFYFKALILTLMGTVLSLTTQAQTQTLTSIEYLKGISGKQTVAGVHNPSNALPAQYTQEIFNFFGRKPALWSADFSYDVEQISHRWNMIQEAKRQWEAGALVSLAWDACNPVLVEPCSANRGIYSRLSDAQWAELITDGTPLNNRWKSGLDDIAVYLEHLQVNKVEVIFRPLRQINYSAFWWGGRPGPQGSRKLYEISRDYLHNNKGLHNLVWGWDLLDLGSLSVDRFEYRPKPTHFDLVTLTVDGSQEGNDFIDSKYQLMLEAAAPDKLLGLGESNSLPRVNELQKQSRWSFFLSGNYLPMSANFLELFRLENVLKLDQLPRRASSPVNLASNVADSNPNSR
jgi:mannan endo-1,4-beta-mannosidase